jgi:hypothetical protein
MSAWSCADAGYITVYVVAQQRYLQPVMTPGLQFLRYRLPILLTPVSLVIILNRIAARTSVVIPVWVYVIVATLPIPAYAAIRIVLRNSSERRCAAALGAQLAPVVRGKWPGNLNVSNRMAQNFEHGYLGKRYLASKLPAIPHTFVAGDGLWEFSEELGPAFNMSALWKSIIVTSEPSYIKVSP